MKKNTKFPIKTLIFVGLILLYFSENIYGYYRFKQYCSNEGGLKVYEKLEKNVGWLAEDKYQARVIANVEGVKFVRYLSDEDKKEYDLYRYWRQLTTPAGEVVQYSTEEMAQLFALSNPSLSQFSVSAIVSSVAFQTFSQEVLGSNEVGLGVIGADETVHVTGHSLGGHLAYIFARLFPEAVDEVVTLNAPGFDPINTSTNGDGWLTVLGFPPFPDSRITAVNAEGDAIGQLGSIHPGTSVNIAQETNESLIASFSSNHSSLNAVDAADNPCLAFSQTRYQYIPVRSIPSSLTPTVCDSAQQGLLVA